jgi:Na+/H+ antiporter NhaD/arsenite permease-like protein
MDWLVVSVFCLVYVGLILGRLPFLALDRTGVALLGAIVLVAFGRVDTARAWSAVDVPTLALLFGLMVVSAQLRLGGAYTRLVQRLTWFESSPAVLLAALIGAAGLLSALLANDIVCLAMAPILVEGCARRRYDPRPFLLGLAAASNVGSAATLIGNPQNILIGQVLKLSFASYLWDALVPSMLGLAVVWAVIAVLYRGRWEGDTPLPRIESPAFDRWQTAKGAAVMLGLVAAFLIAPWPREVVALAAAGILLCSRRMRSRQILGLTDWQLLVLFVALFVVNDVVKAAGLFGHLTGLAAGAGIDLTHPAWLFGAGVVLSNVVSNVPATMLLLPSATHPLAGPVLALSTTLAGNLLVVGSIANIIVLDQAARLGVVITWRDHARVGVPVTLSTLALAAGWLWLRAV